MCIYCRAQMLPAHEVPASLYSFEALTCKHWRNSSDTPASYSICLSDILHTGRRKTAQNDYFGPQSVPQGADSQIWPHIVSESVSVARHNLKEFQDLKLPTDIVSLRSSESDRKSHSSRMYSTNHFGKAYFEHTMISGPPKPNTYPTFGQEFFAAYNRLSSEAVRRHHFCLSQIRFDGETGRGSQKFEDRCESRNLPERTGEYNCRLRTKRKRCECGCQFPRYGLPGQKGSLARWCLQCPTKPANAVDVFTKRCECQRSKPCFGLPGESSKAARWCATCPTRPPGSVDVVNKRCECGQRLPSFALPGEGRKHARWCALCPTKSPRAVNVINKKCLCGLSKPSLGLPGEEARQARWCSRCPTKPGNAVDVINKRCECGKGRPCFLLPGEPARAVRWCVVCPGKPAIALNIRAGPKRRKIWEMCHE